MDFRKETERRNSLFYSKITVGINSTINHNFDTSSHFRNGRNTKWAAIKNLTNFRLPEGFPEDDVIYSGSKST